MKAEIIIAGFGGQGVMSIGQVLAYAGMHAGKQVSWMPSYGPEQRGGTAHVSVVISDDAVDSPIVSVPSYAVILNDPSLEKFLPKISTNGVLLINSDCITSEVERKDLYIAEIGASSIAAAIGNERVSGIVLLGALVQMTSLISREDLTKGLADVFGGEKQHLLAMNEAALQAGERAAEINFTFPII
ncbi:2-oxoacid:acceptor oxidoreductase family protein [Salisediminibacterium halotolerans]|uniref:2-oxoacid:acceptor oxidoreductase family protein n=1 Tax=Salisediminibacterium halotolerans TaxID=517425 RepID=UPI000EAFB2C3|nr:2-oxoacid:acceptor oxidoreductase family protein [Salisediminibacterium halotolerans]RLJ77970.1 2-oxoglutarate ferredoxin oxidoreductase gamma subunit [Actinophytocola xinjiangensis]RPE88692.1 2-oxoglutarate ferredoxin oxidoreductase gamma subunit [Salisediminibacterium halotolerans]TWG36947.1 2-oxoglutarate ferredoxin oxidoreductase gamma subunit [Salisediminibacterium halotolerans]GEL08092.1 2-oxoglutarate ferredoxin oxidoreductase subunit gamma [Salisediminibacterium halotolerans]